jgi:hypothetical protein
MTAVTHRAPEDVRADLDEWRDKLAGLSDGSIHWSDVYDDLANGALQDIAVEQAAEQVADLENELRYVNGGTGK